VSNLIIEHIEHIHTSQTSHITFTRPPRPWVLFQVLKNVRSTYFPTKYLLDSVHLSSLTEYYVVILIAGPRIICPLRFQVQLDKNLDADNHVRIHPLRVEFLLRIDSGYPKDMGDILFTLAIPGNSLRYTPPGHFHQSPPVPGALGRGPSHQSHVLRVEHRDTYNRPKSVVRVIRGVA